MPKIEKLTILSNNLHFPSIGLGTWHIKDQSTIDTMILNSYNAGYRLIDTASKYDNENLIGNAIKKYNLNRSELFITSKIWKDDKGYYNVLKAFDRTINNLQTDYLDLYLIHWPMTSDNWEELNIDTWKALEYLYNTHKVKAIGVSNFMPQHLDALLPYVNIMPMINQIEFHPGFTQISTIKYCQEKNIQIEAWSPLGSGNIFSNKILQNLSIKYKKTIAQICLRWALQNNVIPLPKSTNLNRIKENINIYNFSIDDNDMKVINSIPSFCYSGLNPNIIYK